MVCACVCRLSVSAFSFLRIPTIQAFGPVLAVKYLEAMGDPAAFLEAATEFCNTKLYGSLSMNIVISPSSLAAIGADKFDVRWIVSSLLFVSLILCSFFPISRHFMHCSGEALV